MKEGSDCSAFTGLEAAIVLIAFVTVASVFSYVVLGLGFSTTQKSQEVIYQSMGQVSSVIMVTGDVIGISTTGSTIEMVNFTFRVSAGGGSVDFETVSVTYSNATQLEQLRPIPGWRGSSTTPGTWAVIDRQNEKGTPNNLHEAGEQYTISVHPTHGIVHDGRFSVEVIPAGGSATGIRRTSPGQIKTVNRLY